MVTISGRLHVLLARDAPIGLDYPDGEWAEIDGQRLVWAAGGKLYSGTIGNREYFGSA